MARSKSRKTTAADISPPVLQVWNEEISAAVGASSVGQGEPTQRPRAASEGAGCGGEPQPGSSLASGELDSVGTRPNNVYLPTRQSGDFSYLQNSVTSLDWVECSGIVQWNEEESDLEFLKLYRLRQQAEDSRQPIPVDFPSVGALLHPRGMGSGNQSRLSYRLEFGGVTLGLSDRNNVNRKQANFYLKIPGTACLMFGVVRCAKLARRILRSLGGALTDIWLRRLDLCLDLPEMDLREDLLPTYEAAQFLTTATKWNPWDGKDGKTGFTIGQAPRLLLNVYDKKLDTFRRHDEPYQQAMIASRWGGVIPEHATRIEYQVNRDWFAANGLNSVDRLRRLRAEFVHKLTSFGPYPFFCLRDRPVDRENRHQDRSEVAPLWRAIVERFQDQVANPQQKLFPPRHGRITCSRATSTAVGLLLKAGAQLGRTIMTIDELKELLGTLCEVNELDDSVVFERSSRKRRELGLVDGEELPF